MSYFVTGATGFIGRFLVSELVDHRDGPIHVLVRESSLPRMEAMIQRWGSDRVIPVIGDLGSPGLGVDRKTKTALKGKIDHFFHLAAIYDMTADDATNEALNVDGTRHALELATAISAGCFHQVSSVAAAGDYHGTFDETMFAEEQHLPSAYHRTKYESERIVREEATLPWRVYRPAIVVGDSELGTMDKVDGPYYFFPVIKRLRDALPSWLPMMGIDLGDTNVVPVDYVAKAMDHLAHLPDHDGEAFHLVNPEPQSVVEMVNGFCAAAGAPQFATPVDRRVTNAGALAFVPRSVRPSTLVNGALRSGAVQAALGQTIGRLGVPAEVLSHTNFSAVFDSRRTEQALAGSGISVPVLESYSRMLWNYWEENLDQSTARDSNARKALEGKYVVITGASSGIGQVTALKVAQAGGIPVLVARGKDKLDDLRLTIELRGGKAHVFPCDLSDLEAIDSLCEQLVAELPVHRLPGQQRRPVDPALAQAQPGPLPRLRAHDAAQLLRGDPADHRPDADDAKPGPIAHRQHQLDRRPDQPAAVLGVRRLQGRARRLEQRGRLRGRRRRRHLHQHPHAAGQDADDRADEALRQVPHDLTRAGGGPGGQGARRAAARAQHDARQRGRDRPHGGAEGGVPGAEHGLPRVPRLGRRPRLGRHEGGKREGEQIMLARLFRGVHW